MKKLIGFEIKKVNMKQNILIGLLISLGILVFMFFFSGITYMKPQDVAENEILGSYDFIYMMGLLIGIVAYTVQAAMIFSANILDEYKNDGLYLLFTYPINRIKQFNAKVFVSLLTIILIALFGMTLAMKLFTLIQYIFPILPQDFVIGKYFSVILNVVQSSILVGLMGTIAMLISFTKKSGFMAIAISIVLAAIVCNLLSILNVGIIAIICLVLFIITIALYMIKRTQINKIEVL